MNINDFYKWAKHTYSKEDGATHPINWITVCKYSDIFSDEYRKTLPGLNLMIETMKKILTGRKYEYVVSPCAFEKLKIKPIMNNWDVKNLCPLYYGQLLLKKDKFYLSGFENRNVPIYKTWILKEIK